MNKPLNGTRSFLYAHGAITVDFNIWILLKNASILKLKFSYISVIVDFFVVFYKTFLDLSQISKSNLSSKKWSITKAI